MFIKSLVYSLVPFLFTTPLPSNPICKLHVYCIRLLHTSIAHGTMHVHVVPLCAVVFNEVLLIIITCYATHVAAVGFALLRYKIPLTVNDLISFSFFFLLHNSYIKIHERTCRIHN